MVNSRRTRGGYSLIVLLTGLALHAQQPTPAINGPNASPPGLQSSPLGVSFSCPGATNGAAITAVPEGQGICLYINGNFNATGRSETPIWTDSPNGAVTLELISYPTDTQLIAYVPSQLYAVAETATITVVERLQANNAPPGVVSNGATFTVNPVLSGASLPAGIVGTPYSQPFFNGGTGPFVPTGLTAPPGLSYSNLATNLLQGTPTAAGSYTVTGTITDAWQNVITLAEPLPVYNRLLITTTGLPGGTVGSSYFAQLFGSGGLSPYLWSATGLPGGLSINPATGAISGNPTQSGAFSVSVTLTDGSLQTARATLGITIGLPPPPPVQITTSSLPNGTVGVYYAALIGANGGSGGPYTFSASGGLPPGLQVANNGQLQGTPTAPGNFSFSVTATDSAGNSGSGSVSIAIAAAPLVITTGALNSVQAGSPFSVTFAAAGGVPPYTYALGGSAPPGSGLTGNTLSGTPATPGSYSFTVTVTDTVKTTASKGFTLVVTPGPLTISASLPGGQAGAAYSGQFSATGGTPPYSWSGSAGGGLSVSASGAVTGTPTAAGTYSVSVTVTDSQGLKANATYSVTITPSSLSVTTASLPNGALTSPYSAGLNATGGTPPYTWSASGLPAGIAASSGGTLTGTPTSPGAFTVTVTVKDSTGVSATANLALTILPAPLKIITTSISPPTLGTSFSTGFGATGGTPPYTWAAAGLPAGITITSSGTLSGTPTALGSSSITVTVTDSNGQQAGETLALTVILPAAPNVTLTGLPATVNPATQSTVSATFNSAFPVDVTVNLTLTFAPLAGADDPNIQFSTGGRTATLTVKAGATSSSATIGLQTGTVAGTITITSQLVAAGQNITPVPAPTKTIVIAPAAPSVTSVTATTNSTGFTVTFDGFDTTRAITQVIFTFTAASGATLQTSSVTVPAATLFTSWYQSSASTAYGSQFSFTIPFTVTGNVQSLTSVTVTLVNPTGTSTSMTASL
jgi:hypothetical protein